jgi:LytS/YehU family sensor histidine kinase
MNHRNTTLVVAAIVAAAALTGVAFAIPQQVMAGGYYGHRHHNNNHNANSIKVDQAVNQLNACNSTSSAPDHGTTGLSTDNSGSGSGTLCLNTGSNSADIHGNNHR